MATKIMAAKIAVTAGAHFCIAAGSPRHPVRRIEQGARCTWFKPRSSPVAARKQWIAGTLRPAGELVVDAGAERALRAGKSLLPAGVTALRGRFERGDTVSVVTSAGREIARGIVAYSDAETARIIGRRSGRCRGEDPGRQRRMEHPRRCRAPTCLRPDPAGSCAPIHAGIDTSRPVRPSATSTLGDRGLGQYRLPLEVGSCHRRRAHRRRSDHRQRLRHIPRPWCIPGVTTDCGGPVQPR